MSAFRPESSPTLPAPSGADAERAPSAAAPYALRPERAATPRAAATRPLARALLVAAGTLLTLLAALGAFLPVLPTTPFVLLAGACFVRSSPALHRRLLANRLFGPYLAQWQRDHTVPREAKRKAYALVVVSFGFSIAVVDATWLRLLLASLAVALVAFLRWLPTTRASASPNEIAAI